MLLVGAGIHIRYGINLLINPDGAIGAYNVPGMGDLVYCGLEGWMSPLRHITEHNDLGHPLCDHLRQGTWALDYIHARLEKSVVLSFLFRDFISSSVQTSRAVPPTWQASSMVLGAIRSHQKHGSTIPSPKVLRGCHCRGIQGGMSGGS